ncbi:MULTISPECIES: RpiB/LacA/LacB family sugar-phosphate isomerase [unclassified Synechocystis]|uniref:RpiB/LacA/LacB family sugar-phosphate isomerase n=1 Tax=unclassified Synechocystis TaxID=2640012 RepID=UPI00042723F0|nr:MULTISPECIES: RpiB/LacA/LacB family sugar-phosphate isomerase [unclassified Synechocystis]AIE75186.1 Ribose 5-phosphate isomerase [Synechocystis sp. PCC 6714]MCT0252948.1 RpiB/LacA/LacB family sugar-phosphate isomerase [Synechocystis sp. CS-94]
MKIAVGSDEKCHLTDVVIEHLQELGHGLMLFGPLAGETMPWPLVAQQLAEAVADQTVEEGILFCWTGTGASIAANKVPGVRAALVRDAETAQGARWWNDANVLVMSLRATSPAIAKEILVAWFAERVKPDELECIQLVTAIEQKYSGQT